MTYIFSGVVSGKPEDVIAAALEQAGETGMTRTEIRDLLVATAMVRHEFTQHLPRLQQVGRPGASSGLPLAAYPTV